MSYARIWSRKQEKVNDLACQIDELNFKRKGFTFLLGRIHAGGIRQVAVLHKDRLWPFGLPSLSGSWKRLAQSSLFTATTYRPEREANACTSLTTSWPSSTSLCQVAVDGVPPPHGYLGKQSHQPRNKRSAGRHPRVPRVRYTSSVFNRRGSKHSSSWNGWARHVGRTTRAW